MSVLDNFQDWKNFLSQRVEQAQGMGMDERDHHRCGSADKGDYCRQGDQPSKFSGTPVAGTVERR